MSNNNPPPIPNRNESRNRDRTDIDLFLLRMHELEISRQREDLLRDEEELERRRVHLQTRRFFLEQEESIVRRQLQGGPANAPVMNPPAQAQPRPNMPRFGYPYPQPRNGFRRAEAPQVAPRRDARVGNVQNLQMPAPQRVAREYAAGLGRCRGCLRRPGVFACCEHNFSFCSVECQTAACFLFERQTAPLHPVEQMLATEQTEDDDDLD